MIRKTIAVLAAMLLAGASSALVNYIFAGHRNPKYEQAKENSKDFQQHNHETAGKVWKPRIALNVATECKYKTHAKCRTLFIIVWFMIR